MTFFACRSRRVRRNAIQDAVNGRNGKDTLTHHIGRANHQPHDNRRIITVQKSRLRHLSRR